MEGNNLAMNPMQILQGGGNPMSMLQNMGGGRSNPMSMLQGMGGGNQNPMQMFQMLQGSGNPMQMLQGMAQNNPQLAQAMKILDGKSPQEAQQWVTNYAQESGQDINAILSQFGVNQAK